MVTATQDLAPARTQGKGASGHDVPKGPESPRLKLQPLPGSELTNEHALSDFENVDAVLRSKAFWVAAAQFPGNETQPIREQGGRPSAHPPWVFLLMFVVAYCSGTSQRRTVKNLRDVHTWRRFRRVANKVLPDNWRRAARQAPTREMWKYFMHTIKDDAYSAFVNDAVAAVKGCALATAQQRACFDEAEPFRFKKVNLNQWVTADGTVFGSLTKQHNDTNGTYREGGANHDVFGTKFAIVESISKTSLGGQILGFAHVTPGADKKQGDEAATTVNLLETMKAEAPGIRGVTIDSVANGTHIKKLLEIGMFVINHPHAAANPDSATKGRYNKNRREQTHSLKTITTESCQHCLVLKGTQPCEEVLTVDGKYDLKPLESSGVKKQTLANGTFVYRTTFIVPCPYGNHEYLLRLDIPAADEAPNNRAALARVYTVDSPEFKQIYGCRNYSESMHAKIKRRMEKIPAKTKQRQILFMLAAQLSINAESDYMWHLKQQIDGG